MFGPYRTCSSAAVHSNTCRCRKIRPCSFQEFPVDTVHVLYHEENEPCSGISDTEAPDPACKQLVQFHPINIVRQSASEQPLGSHFRIMSARSWTLSATFRTPSLPTRLPGLLDGQCLLIYIHCCVDYFCAKELTNRCPYVLVSGAIYFVR